MLKQIKKKTFRLKKRKILILYRKPTRKTRKAYKYGINSVIWHETGGLFIAILADTTLLQIHCMGLHII